MVEIWPIIKQALGEVTNPQLQQAVAELDEWYAAGSHRRDLSNVSISSPGTYEHNEAISLMDAWWPKLLHAEFGPALGEEAYGSLRGMLEFGSPEPGSEPEAPDFADGWYGYVHKDLRATYLPMPATVQRRAAPTRACIAAKVRSPHAPRRSRAPSRKRWPSLPPRSTATGRAPKTRRPAAST